MRNETMQINLLPLTQEGQDVQKLTSTINLHEIGRGEDQAYIKVWIC